MRIYNENDNKLINEVEIFLTLEEAEDFHFRINDAAHNPGYKYDAIIDDFIEGDVIERDDGLSWINKSIRIFLYTESNLKKYSEFSYKIITEDKL